MTNPDRRPGVHELEDAVFGHTAAKSTLVKVALSDHLHDLQIALDRKESEAITAIEAQLSVLFEDNPKLRNLDTLE